MKTDTSNDVWLPVIGRALAFTCIHSTGLEDKGMAEKAQFLEYLGLPRKDAATLLETTEGSIRALLHYAEKSKDKEPNKGKPKKRSRVI
ncbi:MAG: hypothetical protein MUO85_01130 [candidate division Zixibacteria bacterium]|nr:hypothetical protein [candidate division Zixibacteria bacterium]